MPRDGRRAFPPGRPWAWRAPSQAPAPAARVFPLRTAARRLTRECAPNRASRTGAKIMTTISPVLLAEDEESDVLFMERAFAKAGVMNPLIAVHNGSQVVAYLDGEGKYADRLKYPEPFLLLLDLKMPLMDGFEVLEWIQQKPRWRDGLPVIVLTASGHDPDLKRALDLGAHEYLIKPSDMHGLVTMVTALKLRWLESDLPRGLGHPPVHRLRREAAL
jgi:CheY-like chemotaxis protein